ncbi:hypothetical protein DENIS_4899 [Desulfonema ishimotonii]|uniref:Uncharacterized protein n=1 Tax=Desulfonema ishimotonii TaxID=45657 RepID=A0A401G3U2_9BACT|nr:hypothetical protein DENIS_4899 [Desulfonema ishimotonii]
MYLFDPGPRILYNLSWIQTGKMYYKPSENAASYPVHRNTIAVHIPVTVTSETAKVQELSECEGENNEYAGHDTGNH